ncbi:glycosyltransferase [Candidatus Kaiserbacteria bacterium]|nr:glycosyltransferase [Candidatus Kaiserbacteria bacterium]
MAKISATLAILTKNSGKTLKSALESAKDFDDIVICDGSSTDDTLEIAQQYGARIVPQDLAFLKDGKIFDYAAVRNQTLDSAKHNWFFFLDSDEYCGEDLITAVREVVASRSEGAFWVNRKYVIDGIVIDCAATYPNRQMRFFARNSANRFIKQVHERIQLKDGVVPEFLPGTTYIPFDPDILAIRRKWDYQIAVAAGQARPLSPAGFLWGAIQTTKVSLLWLFRLARNTLFCHGTKMPLKFEMERHYFHFRLLRALWHEVRF